MNDRLLALLLRRQSAINSLASVAIEYPQLRVHPLLADEPTKAANSQQEPTA